MEINVRVEQGRVPVTVFRVKGNIDGATYQQLQSRAQEEIDTGTRDVLMDLTEVPYMSSAGLRVLNYMYSELRSDAPEESDKSVREGISKGTFKSPHLKLLNPTPRVMQALQMAGFDMFLEIHLDLHEAIASF